MADVPQTTPPDTSRNAVIGLAEFHEDIARRFTPGPERDFYLNTAATLRALADEKVYPRD